MLATLDIDAVRTALRVNGGFTLDPRTGRLLTVGEDIGYAIAIPGTERLIGDTLTAEDFRSAIDDAVSGIRDADRETIYVSGWFSDDRGYMVELTDVLHVDAATAEGIGRLRGQDAIFDLANGKEIPVRYYASA